MKIRWFVVSLIICLGVPTGLFAKSLPLLEDLTSISQQPIETLGVAHSPWVWAIPVALVFTVDDTWTAAYQDRFKPGLQDFSHGIYPHRRDFVMTQSFQMLLMAQTDDPNHFTRKLGYLSSIAWIEATGITMGVKFLTGRARPQSGSNAQDWFHVGHTDTLGRFTSFPSSHATIYFSVSTIWGKMLHDEFLGDVLGGANFLIMEGEHNHYVSDMVMGYLLGKAIGNYVWAQHAQDDLTSAWVLYPIYLTKEDTYFGCGLLRQF